VILLIEVSESSLEYDREVKLTLYARAAVRELWIVDLAGEAVEVYRDPTQGRYEVRERLSRGATLSPTLLPGMRLLTDEVLG
jgi:Uma2 family endonuclease